MTAFFLARSSIRSLLRYKGCRLIVTSGMVIGFCIVATPDARSEVAGLGNGKGPNVNPLPSCCMRRVGPPPPPGKNIDQDDTDEAFALQLPLGDIVLGGPPPWRAELCTEACQAPSCVTCTEPPLSGVCNDLLGDVCCAYLEYIDDPDPSKEPTVILHSGIMELQDCLRLPSHYVVPVQDWGAWQGCPVPSNPKIDNGAKDVRLSTPTLGW